MRQLVDRVLRLPIRVRITLTAAVAMGCLFGLLGVLLYRQFQTSLNSSIDTALRDRAVEISRLSSSARKPPSRLPAPSLQQESQAYAQILNRRGQILAATNGEGQTPLLSAAEIRKAFAHPRIINRGEAARFYALPTRGGALVVVGTSLDQQQDAFITFNWELAAGVPLMLVLASLITYLMTGRLLSPVERMRQQAATISTQDLDSRLPLPTSVDEIRRLASTLNEMLDRLHAGLEHERTFIADASHELRGPLAVLKAELEVALYADGSVGPWREAVSSALEEADRVIALAEDLLLLAGAEQETSRTFAVLTADRVVAGAAKSVEKQAHREDRQLVVSTSPPDLTFAADQDQITRALLNLTSNALRYGAGRITLSAREADDCIELHVLDEGPGFPPEFLPHAFDRFSRADPARARGGTGLGLAIADSIARAHGGSVHAANGPHGGADVWLTLPRDQLTLGRTRH